MRYELALLFKPLSTDEIKDKIIPKLEKLVKEVKGTLKMKVPLGKRLLAYPIDKYKEGVYFFYTLDLPAAKTDELLKFLNLTSEVLRFLIIKERDL